MAHGDNSPTGPSPPPPPPPPPGTLPPPAMVGPGSGRVSPQGTAILVLGIVGLVGILASMVLGCFCMPVSVCSWIAFFMGQSARQQYPACQQTQVGWVLGLVGVILSVLAVLAVGVVFAFVGGTGFVAP